MNSNTQRLENNSTGSSNSAKVVVSIRLPTETWSDVFKFLSRRILLNQVQPTSRRFHAIAEHKVDNVHVIRNFGYFLDGLVRDLPLANKQKMELVASDASLAKHFRLDETITFYVKRQTEYDLERAKGCRLRLALKSNSIENPREYLVYLSLLQLISPCCIDVTRWDDEFPKLQMDELLCMPVMLNCPWLAFSEFRCISSNTDSICKWLR